MLLGHVVVGAANSTNDASGGVNTQMDCPMGPQLSPILVGKRTKVAGGSGRRLGDGGFLFDLRLDGSGLVLHSDIFFFGRDMLGLDTLNLFVNKTGLALDGDGGGGGGLGFLFDSSRSRGTRRRGGVEEELQRHLVLSHTTVVKTRQLRADLVR
jgi:hypothetical protein